jgi:hypothetical protein
MKRDSLGGEGICRWEMEREGMMGDNCEQKASYTRQANNAWAELKSEIWLRGQRLQKRTGYSKKNCGVEAEFLWDRGLIF